MESERAKDVFSACSFHEFAFSIASKTSVPYWGPVVIEGQVELEWELVKSPIV